MSRKPPKAFVVLEVPAEAPARYADREPGKYRNPAHFILEHYGPFLGRPFSLSGLTRRDLWRLDRPLYKALYDWLGNGENHQDPDWRALKDRLPLRRDRKTAMVEHLRLAIDNPLNLPVPGKRISLIYATSFLGGRRKMGSHGL